MWDRRNVCDIGDIEPGGIQCTHRGFTPGSWAFNENVEILRSKIVHHRAQTLSRNLCRERCAFAGPAEAATACSCPAQGITLAIGDCNNCVVERRVDVRDTIDNRLFNTLFYARR